MSFRALVCAALLVALAACATDRTATAPEGPAVTPMPSAPLDAGATLTRIAFGSCLKQGDPMPILDAVMAAEPQLMVLLGDNVYGDVQDLTDPAMPELVAAYSELAARDRFTALRRDIPLLTVWDDHDYGLNDAGGAFPLKRQAEEIFADAWALPADDPRRARPGVYTSATIGPEGRRVQLILLDTRYFRDPLRPTDAQGAPGRERYAPKADEDAQMLGARQEAWLADVLREPADLRILVSSVQVIADGHGWEAWRMLPAARARLYRLIAEAGADNLVIVSGDRHLGGFYRNDEAAPFPLVEMTSSSLNAPQSRWRERDGITAVEAGPKRLGDPVYEANFGEIAIDWEARTLTMTLRGEDGAPQRSLRTPIGHATARYRQPDPQGGEL